MHISRAADKLSVAKATSWNRRHSGNAVIMNDQWYFVRQGRRIGPVPIDQIRAEIAAGRLGPGDLVWHSGMPQWLQAHQVPELAANFVNRPMTRPISFSPSAAQPVTISPPIRSVGARGASPSGSIDIQQWLMVSFQQLQAYWLRLFCGYPEAIRPLPNEAIRLSRTGLQGRLATYALWRRGVLWIASGFSGAAGTFFIMQLLYERDSSPNLTAFGIVVQYSLPIISLLLAGIAAAAAETFERLAQSMRLVIWGGLMALLVPIVIMFSPSDWLVEFPNQQLQTVAEYRLQRTMVSMVIGINFYLAIMPLVLSLLPAASRGCQRIKLFFPTAMVPGWGMVTGIPLFVLLTLATIVLIYHVIGNFLLLVSLALWIGAPLFFLSRFYHLIRPLTSLEDVATLVRTQYLVFGLTWLGIILFIIYLFTAKFGDKYLIGLHETTSWIRPWDMQIHSRWMEYVGRLLYYSVLFADIVLITTHVVWREERSFRTRPESQEFDHQMEELGCLLATEVSSARHSVNAATATSTSNAPLPNLSTAGMPPTPPDRTPSQSEGRTPGRESGGEHERK